MSPCVFRYFTLLVFLSAILSGCGGGGGGGGGTSDQFSLSTNNMVFTAVSPSTVVSSQPITGTVNGNLSGTLYIVATVNGNAVNSISNFSLNPGTNSGTAYVYPANASSLGAGTYSSTITVRACLNDSTCNTGELSGSPKTVNVTYKINPPRVDDNVMPHAVKSGTSGSVIIRGNNFITDNVNNVKFNTTDASSLNVISETEIHATYPALNAGTYTVHLNNTSGPVNFTGDLVVTDSPAFTSGTVAYPTTSPQVLKLIYDADNQALLVAVSYFDGINFNTTSRQNNQILRYQFSSGKFVSMTSTKVPLLQGMDLSQDGSKIVAVADRKLYILDPSTLALTAQGDVPPLTDVNQYMKDIVMMNDGSAVITTGYDGSGNTPVYLYSVASGVLNETNHPSVYNGTLAGAANGSYATFIQGSLSPAAPVSDYTASTGIFAQTSINANQVQCINSYMGNCVYPAVSPSGNTFALIDNTLTVSIYDRSFTMLGKLPITSDTIAYNSDGTSLYALDGNTLRKYDLTAKTDINSNFPQIGTGTSISSPGSAPVRMILSADGDTLFIAGRSQIVIQPAP